MTHDELLAKINANYVTHNGYEISALYEALRAVVGLHFDNDGQCFVCADLNYKAPEANEQDTSYPCPTIKAIEKELK